jgi:hypothetical protein
LDDKFGGNHFEGRNTVKTKMKTVEGQGGRGIAGFADGHPIGRGPPTNVFMVEVKRENVGGRSVAILVGKLRNIEGKLKIVIERRIGFEVFRFARESDRVHSADKSGRSRRDQIFQYSCRHQSDKRRITLVSAYTVQSSKVRELKLCQDLK